MSPSAPLPTLDTARLRLRPPELADAPAMFAAWTSNPVVPRYVTWPTHTEVRWTESYVQESRARRDAGAACDWLIRLRPNAEPIGSIELRLQGHRAELGYVLARPRWNQGYATEAARAVVDRALAQPDLWRVWAVCDVKNAAAPLGRTPERGRAAGRLLLLRHHPVARFARVDSRIQGPHQYEPSYTDRALPVRTSMRMHSSA